MQSSSSAPVRRGAVAVVQRDHKWLVIQRSMLVSKPGKFCFPGGKIEPGESEANAIQRELWEELQCRSEPDRLLWRSVSPWGVHLAWWRVSIPDDAILIPAPAEVAGVHWLTTHEMLALQDLLESNRHFLKSLADGEFTLD